MTANTFIEEAKSEGIVRYVVVAVIAREGTVLLLRRKLASQQQLSRGLPLHRPGRGCRRKPDRWQSAPSERRSPGRQAQGS